MATRAVIQAFINALGTGEANTALEVRTALNALLEGVSLTGDTKEIVCDGTYLAANFNMTPGLTMGLGTNERLGWAIMNGNNGTPNDDGLTVIAYGATYNTLEDTLGSKDAVVVTHGHAWDFNTQAAETGGGSIYQEFTTDPGGIAIGGTNNPIVEEGVSGTDKNMQPSRVRLRIMKL